MANIEKIRENLYIKKGWDGYRVVYPTKIDLDKPFGKGNINWKNLIGQWHFWLKSFIFLLALYFFVQMYLHDTKQCRDYVNNFETICSQYSSTLIKGKSYQDNLTSQFPEFNFTLADKLIPKNDS
jgi:hypothetical protein